MSRNGSTERYHSPKRMSDDKYSDHNPEYNIGYDVMNIADEDASFILGAGGRTKRKLSRVCGAELNIRDKNGKTILEIRGDEASIERAKLYVDFVMQQRVGPVRLGFDPSTRTDLTCIKVPHECVGYVTGRKGQGLRSIEKEWGTLMFFTDLQANRTAEFENLAIFGPDEKMRRGAELKVMSAVEQKMSGHFTSNLDDTEGFSTDRMHISEADYSYALGREGATRRKLSRASGAVLEYVGRIAFIAGTKPERRRARDYLTWLCQQRTSFVQVVDENKEDCLVVYVPANCVAYVTGSRGSSLRRIEEHSSTFIFLESTSRERDKERLFIFGSKESDRKYARELVLDRIDEKLSGRSNRDSRSRSRSPGNNWWNRRNNDDRKRRYSNDRYNDRMQSNKYHGRNNDLGRYSPIPNSPSHHHVKRRPSNERQRAVTPERYRRSYSPER